MKTKYRIIKTTNNKDGMIHRIQYKGFTTLFMWETWGYGSLDWGGYFEFNTQQEAEKFIIDYRNGKEPALDIVKEM